MNEKLVLQLRACRTRLVFKRPCCGILFLCVNEGFGGIWYCSWSVIVFFPISSCKLFPTLVVSKSEGLRVSLSATLQTHLSKLKVAQSLESMNGTTCFNHPPFSNYLCTSTHSFKLKERRGSPQGNPTGSHDCHVASCLWRGCKYERR